MTAHNVSLLPWTADFKIDHAARTIHLADTSKGSSPGPSLSKSLAQVVNAALESRIFPQLSNSHSEEYHLLGANHPVTLERFPSPLFGIASRGAHMTAYVGAGPSLKVWVAQRSRHIYTYPGKLDTSVAGGVKASDTALDCIVAEADEEASLDTSFVREHVVPTGMISYLSRNVKNDTYQPVVLYVFDLQVPSDMPLKPHDDEVEAFHLMSVREVFDAMLEWRFKPNCCLVMIDFFVRHGVITEENEPDYLELLTRLRRPLPVPLAPSRDA